MPKFAENIQATIWTEGENRPREFRAWYLFNEGFAFLEEAIRVVETAGFPKDGFRYVIFKKNIYPVSWQGYDNGLVIDRESFHILHKAFGDWETYPIRDLYEYPVAFPVEVDPDDQLWQNGIQYDLTLADENIRVVDCQGNICGDETENQAIILVGMQYFISEICINTDRYISHVFSHYFSNRSMSYKIIKDIDQLRSQGVSHYNPFSKSTSNNQKESKKKRDKLIGDAVVTKSERSYLDPVTKEKDFTEREKHPAKIDRNAYYRYSRRRRY